MPAPVCHSPTSPEAAGRWTTAGPSWAKAAASASASSSRLHGYDRTPNASASARKSGWTKVDAGRLPELVALVLPQDPVAAVVDEKELGVEPVLAGGGQLRDPVVEAAVAGDREHRAPGAASEAPSAAGQA